MNNFNPCLPPPDPMRRQNKTYANGQWSVNGNPAGNSSGGYASSSYPGGGYVTGNYSPTPYSSGRNMSSYPSYGGQDAWMQPGYPGRTPSQMAPYPRPMLPPAQPTCSGPKNPNKTNCFVTKGTAIGGGVVGGAWNGAKWGANYCQTPNPKKFLKCFAGSAAVGAATGGAAGYTTAVNSSSCQDVLKSGSGGSCTNKDPGHKHFRNHVER